ncbi:MAG: hypothetical protein SFU91_05850 [Chloroherpetonaceae bacterium]|nr:hypothetical protein [Chloroherpetonaceae bacterium]
MKKHQISHFFFIVLFLIFGLEVVAQNKTKVSFLNQSKNKAAQSTIEKSVTKLLNNFNSGFLEAETEPDFTDVAISLEGKFAIKRLWQTQAFRCTELELKVNLLELPTGKGYEIRDIPLSLTLDDGSIQKELGVFVFNLKGEIEDLYFGLGTQATKVTNGEDVTDLRLRKLILDFAENFRTSYNRKDILFLQKVFSDNALIITGKVIQEKPSKDMMGLAPARVELIRQTKAQYMKRLRDVFKASRYIKVEFDSLEVVRHPALPHIYGVNLVQNYATPNYSDRGYLFLLIDFRDENSPIIHVRAWQPSKETSGDSVLKLSDFPVED